MLAVRAGLVTSVRQQILAGTYDSADKVEGALGELLEEIVLR